MKFFPFEKFILESKHPVHEIIYRTRRNTEAKHVYRNPAQDFHRWASFEGSVSTDGFKIRPIIKTDVTQNPMGGKTIAYKLLYRPLYKGKITAKGEGSVLTITAQLSVGAYAMLFILFLFTVLMFLAQLWVLAGIALFVSGGTYWMALDDFKKDNVRYFDFFKQLVQQEHFQD